MCLIQMGKGFDIVLGFVKMEMVFTNVSQKVYLLHVQYLIGDSASR
jgi:hypothetical protein